jgi:hypothetical protein
MDYDIVPMLTNNEKILLETCLSKIDVANKSSWTAQFTEQEFCRILEIDCTEESIESASTSLLKHVVTFPINTGFCSVHTIQLFKYFKNKEGRWMTELEIDEYLVNQFYQSNSTLIPDNFETFISNIAASIPHKYSLDEIMEMEIDF